MRWEDVPWTAFCMVHLQLRLEVRGIAGTRPGLNHHHCRHDHGSGRGHRCHGGTGPKVIWMRVKLPLGTGRVMDTVFPPIRSTRWEDVPWTTLSSAWKHNASAGQVTLAWLLVQGPHIIPIPGTRNVRVQKKSKIRERQYALTPLLTLVFERESWFAGCRAQSRRSTRSA